MIFELPEAVGTFRERAEQIKKIAVEVNVPWLLAIEQLPVADRVSLKKRFAETLAAGGEGLYCI